MKQPNIPLLSPLNPFLEIKINTQLLLLSAAAFQQSLGRLGDPRAGGSRARGCPAAGKSCSEQSLIWDLDGLDVHREREQVRGDT